MSVAVGMIYPNACVVASDTQEIAGLLKRDVRKTDSVGLWGLIEGHRTCVVSNAGYSPFAEAAALNVRRRFEKVKTTHDGMADLVESEILKFHKKHINAVIGTDPRVEISLLVATNHDGKFGLMTTGRTSVIPDTRFSAIGAGSAVAFPLLELLYDPLAPLDAAILAAAYVVWKSKRSVDGVGHFTDITILLPRDILQIARTVTHRWELAFDQIDKFNAITARYAFDFRAPIEDREIKHDYAESIAYLRRLLQQDAAALSVKIAELTGWTWKIQAAPGKSL